MPFEKTCKVIAIRTQFNNPLNAWKRNKSTNTLHDCSLALGLRASTVAPSSKTSHVASWARDISDAIQISAPVVQATVDAIPIAGAPMKAAIGGLLAILQVVDKRIQNSEDFISLTHRLYNLSCHIANAPTARNPFEEASRRALIKVLEDTTSELSKMRSRIRGSAFLTQQIAGCSGKINNHILDYMLSSQMQVQSDVHHVKQFIMALEAGQLPAGMTLGCVTLVDATGWEHKLLPDQCASFQQLRDMLPGLLHQCRPDKAEAQRWYIDKGQYDFVLYDGINVTQLTSESDLWSRIQAGTKIVMRVVTEEVINLFSARYRCPCGNWNDLKTDSATLLGALKYGCCITCRRCERRFQITCTATNMCPATSLDALEHGCHITCRRCEGRLQITLTNMENVTITIVGQEEGTQSSDHGPTAEAKYLIRNLLVKQALSRIKPKAFLRHVH